MGLTATLFLCAEEECFNPGKDEVPFSQFQLFAQTSEVPRLWDDDDMRDSYEYSLGGTKQRFKSCGQFNNVLQLLLHSLTVARTLDRTLILPGFYFRKGLRRTRIDHFQEEWYVTFFVDCKVQWESLDVWVC